MRGSHVGAALLEFRERPLLRLVEQADVLIENYAARVMPNLGLTYEVIAERNPSIVMCSMPGFGQRGPNPRHCGMDLLNFFSDTILVMCEPADPLLIF